MLFRSGTEMWVSMLGFFITAVGFPVLGLVAVAKSKGLYKIGRASCRERV